MGHQLVTFVWKVLLKSYFLVVKKAIRREGFCVSVVVSPAPSLHLCLLLKAAGGSLLCQPQNSHEMSNCHTGAGGAEGQEESGSGGEGWTAEAAWAAPLKTWCCVKKVNI